MTAKKKFVWEGERHNILFGLNEVSEKLEKKIKRVRLTLEEI